MIGIHVTLSKGLHMKASVYMGMNHINTNVSKGLNTKAFKNTYIANKNKINKTKQINKQQNKTLT